MGGDKAAAAASGLVNADAQRVFFAGTGDHRLRGFMYAQIHLLFGAHHCATQGVGQHLGNFHVDELAVMSGVPSKFTTRLHSVRPASSITLLREVPSTRMRWTVPSMRRLNCSACWLMRSCRIYSRCFSLLR